MYKVAILTIQMPICTFVPPSYRLQEAWRDVNRSLSLSPSYSSALWTRHLLHLTAGSHSSALADLQTIASSSPSSSLVSQDCEAGLVFMSLMALVHHNKKTDPSLSLPLLSQVHIYMIHFATILNSTQMHHICGLYI